MALFDHVYVINDRDKPFGTSLPLDIQNRLICVSWYADHRDKYTKVMDELRSLPKCELTDWCSRSTCGFRDTLLLIIDNSLARLAATHCAWCRIYVTDNESLELRTLDLTLQRR